MASRGAVVAAATATLLGIFGPNIYAKVGPAEVDIQHEQGSTSADWATKANYCATEDMVPVIVQQDTFDMKAGEAHCVHIDSFLPPVMERPQEVTPVTPPTPTTIVW